MATLDKTALAKMTDDELKNALIKRHGIVRPIEIVATREQLEQAVLEIRKVMAA